MKFKMPNILFIGSRYVNSVMMRLPHVLAKLGCPAVAFLDSFDFAKAYKVAHPNYDINRCFKGPDFLPLSFYPHVIKQKIKFDYIFIEQNGYNFKNDTDIKCIYYHRDTPTPCFMLDMDILLYRFKEMMNIIPKYHPNLLNNGLFTKRWLNGVDPYEFIHQRNKIYDGINWIMWTKPFLWYWQQPKQVEYYAHVRKLVEHAQKLKLIRFHHPEGCNYLRYREILQQSEAVLIVPGLRAYDTRKIQEAAMTKTLIILHVQNNDALQAFKEFGLKSGENCFFFRSVVQLSQLKKKWAKVRERKEEIVKNAFDWVMHDHTWLNRGVELIKIIKEYEARA